MTSQPARIRGQWQSWRALADNAAGRPISLAALGLLSAAAYAVWWTWPTWLFSASLHRSAIPLEDFLGLSVAGISSYAMGVTFPFLLYLLALRAAGKAHSRLAVAVGITGAVGLPLILLLAYPSLAADAFDYMISGRIIVVRGDNPYVLPPIALHADPYFPPVGFPEHVSIYGPLFLAITTVPVRLAGSHPTVALIIFKLLTIAAQGATAWLVYLIVRRLAPSRALFALVAYAWNPLTVVYFGVDGHNDAFMLVFLAAAIYAAMQERHDIALPLLALSSLIKYVPVLLLPVFFLAAIRQPRQLAIGIVLSVILVGAFFAPFWAGAAIFDGTREQTSKFTSSPASLLRFVVPASVARTLMLACFGLGYAVSLVLVKKLINRSLAILTVYLLTISFWLKGWYLTWPLMLGAILGGWPLILTALWSAGPFLLNVFNVWGWNLNWWHWQEGWRLWMMELWLTSSLLAPLVAGVLAFVAARMMSGGLPKLLGLGNRRPLGPERAPTIE